MTAQTPILVLVTLQRACARLIRVGADMALMQNRPLLVLHVANADEHEAGQPAIDAQTLDYLYALAGEAGAEMSVIAAREPLDAMESFTRERGAQTVLLGVGERSAEIAHALCHRLSGVQVQVLQEDASIV